MASTTTSPDKFHQPSATDSVILSLLRLKKKNLKTETKETVAPTSVVSTVSKRARGIEDQLRKAGLNQAQIDRMKGKKK